ncbi:ABC transporter permease [Neorhizobium sp. NCHU2750]|uniref:ABC transporter permease n=1 Tax=Neorhizobium sp. NCHU2750 TaxID=1825976 RepID=UPI000E71FECB|nr:ABC transporter permease [Neorhizobium sp. NCHU2750]
MSGILIVCRIELRRIFTLKPAFAVLVMAVCLYSVYYPQPYRAEALRDVPIALVDLDGSDSSRELARRIDASSDVAIAAAMPDIASAEREIYTRSLYGILVIPHDFERDLLHGRASPIALYADASYFLIYQRISGAVTAVAKTMGAEIETARLIAQGVDPVMAQAAPDPLPLTAVTLFNPQGGYATYILPAAFMLILQQTLLMGVALLGTLPNPALSAAGPEGGGPFARVFGRLLAYAVIEAVVVAFYLLALPYLYGIPRLGSALDIYVFALPFLIAVASLGMVTARLLRNPLAVQLVLATVGLPFMFLSGFAWPSEAIAGWLRTVGLLLPSSSAIPGMVNIAQLGASIVDVSGRFEVLWVLAITYTALAILMEPAGRRRVGTGDQPA